MSHSIDIRKRVIEYIEDGGLVSRAAKRYEVGKSTIYKWLKKGEEWKEIGKPGPKKNLKVSEELLEERIKEQPDIMQKELALEFKVDRSTICKALKRMKISRKKNVDVRGEMLK